MAKRVCALCGKMVGWGERRTLSDGKEVCVDHLTATAFRGELYPPITLEQLQETVRAKEKIDSMNPVLVYSGMLRNFDTAKLSSREIKAPGLYSFPSENKWLVLPETARIGENFWLEDHFLTVDNIVSFALGEMDSTEQNVWIKCSEMTITVQSQGPRRSELSILPFDKNGYGRIAGTDYPNALASAFSIMSSFRNAFIAARGFSQTISIGGCLSVDEEKGLWYISSLTDNAPVYLSNIFSFSDVLEASLKDASNKTIKGAAGGALVGGALFGTVGAVVGSSASDRTMVENLTQLNLCVTFKDSRKPALCVPLITRYNEDRMKHEKDKNILLADAQDVANYLNGHAVFREEAPASFAEPKPAPASPSSFIDEIVKLKELLDAGVLTGEEFEIAKRKILGQ